MYVEVIQSHWRSYFCRKKVQCFSKLPTDVWNIILQFIREDRFIIGINKLFRLKIIRAFWSPPTVKMQSKIRTITTVKKYFNIMEIETLEETVKLCFRLLKHSRLDTCSVLMINAFIEHYISVFEKHRILKHTVS